MKVTTPHLTDKKSQHEHVLSWSVLIIFSSLFLLNWLFNIFDVTFFIFSTILYVLLGLGIYISTRAAAIVGTTNFAGKALSSFGIMFASFTLSTLLTDYAVFFFEKNTVVILFAHLLWALGALFAILGLHHILHTQKHLYESKHEHTTTLLFIAVFICTLFIVGVPSFISTPFSTIVVDISLLITYTSIITAALFTLGIIKKDAATKYLYPICTGLIAMTFSYTLSIYNVLFATILLVGGIALLIVGIYNIQSYFEKKPSDIL
jgi:hypothetical protein